jgi:uncharacterized integral membrane protein (TIGR00697 family)
MIAIDLVISHRRLQQVAVLVDEAGEVDGRQDGHGASIDGGGPVDKVVDAPSDKMVAQSSLVPASRGMATKKKKAKPATTPTAEATTAAAPATTSGPRTYRYYDLVMAAFVCVLLCANLIGVRKLTAIDLPVVGLCTFAAGNLFFPISYLFGDILTEVYGYARSRRVVWAGFAALLFASIQSAVVVNLPPAPSFHDQEQLVWAFGATWRIAGASLIAYFCGEFVNSFTLAKLKIATEGRWLPLRTIGSTVVGEAVDTLIFYPLAFYGVFDNATLVAVMGANYCIKVGWEVVATPLTVRVVGWFKKKEDEDWYDTRTSFTPFSLKV